MEFHKYAPVDRNLGLEMGADSLERSKHRVNDWGVLGDVLDVPNTVGLCYFLSLSLSLSLSLYLSLSSSPELFSHLSTNQSLAGTSL